MPDLKQNQLYQQVANTISSLGNTGPSGPSLPKINMGTPQVSSGVSGGSGSQIYNQYKSSAVETTPFGGQTRFENSHEGVDLASKPNTVIPSFTEGTVEEVVSGQGKSSTPSFGNYILIKTPDGKYVRYSHLKNSYVVVGDQVSPGKPIAVQGASGSVYSRTPGNSGEHLDLRLYSLYKDFSGKYNKEYINPDKYFSNS